MPAFCCLYFAPWLVVGWRRRWRRREDQGDRAGLAGTLCLCHPSSSALSAAPLTFCLPAFLPPPQHSCLPACLLLCLLPALPSPSTPLLPPSRPRAPPPPRCRAHPLHCCLPHAPLYPTPPTHKHAAHSRALPTCCRLRMVVGSLVQLVIVGRWLVDDGGGWMGGGWIVRLVVGWTDGWWTLDGGWTIQLLVLVR